MSEQKSAKDSPEMTEVHKYEDNQNRFPWKRQCVAENQGLETNALYQEGSLSDFSSSSLTSSSRCYPKRFPKQLLKERINSIQRRSRSWLNESPLGHRVPDSPAAGQRVSPRTAIQSRSQKSSSDVSSTTLSECSSLYTLESNELLSSEYTISSSNLFESDLSLETESSKSRSSRQTTVSKTEFMRDLELSRQSRLQLFSATRHGMSTMNLDCSACTPTDADSRSRVRKQQRQSRFRFLTHRSPEQTGYTKKKVSNAEANSRSPSSKQGRIHAREADNEINRKNAFESSTGSNSSNYRADVIPRSFTHRRFSAPDPGTVPMGPRIRDRLFTNNDLSLLPRYPSTSDLIARDAVKRRRSSVTSSGSMSDSEIFVFPPAPHVSSLHPVTEPSEFNSTPTHKLSTLRAGRFRSKGIKLLDLLRMRGSGQRLDSDGRSDGLPKIRSTSDAIGLRIPNQVISQMVNGMKTTLVTEFKFQYGNPSFWLGIPYHTRRTLTWIKTTSTACFLVVLGNALRAVFCTPSSCESCSPVTIPVSGFVLLVAMEAMKRVSTRLLITFLIFNFAFGTVPLIKILEKGIAIPASDFAKLLYSDRSNNTCGGNGCSIRLSMQSSYRCWISVSVIFCSMILTGIVLRTWFLIKQDLMILSTQEPLERLSEELETNPFLMWYFSITPASTNLSRKSKRK